MYLEMSMVRLEARIDLMTFRLEARLDAMLNRLDAKLSLFGADLGAKLDRLYESAQCVNRLSWLLLIMTTVNLVLVYSKYP